MQPHVIYHIAQMGNWRDVVNQQLMLLRQVGLHRDVGITFLGTEIRWVVDRCIVHGVTAKILQHDPNLNHCETLAMIEVEKLAKTTENPILYFHTKGVSAPHHAQKTDWRRFMEEWVIRRWRENVTYLEDHDAVGVSWWQGGEQHFSGNFWISNPSWIRKLPNFIQYHWDKGGSRFSCEMWIGAHQWCKARSVGLKEQILSWFDFTGHMPEPLPKERTLPLTVCIPTIPRRLNLLNRAVESVKRQTANVKMIVEVDCDKQGAMVTRNKALARVDTPWVAFLDDDDELYPDHCELLYDLAVRSDSDVAYGGFTVLGDEEYPQPSPLEYGNLGDPFNAEELLRGNYIPVTVVAQTKKLIDAGGFQYATGTKFEDYGLWLKLLNTGARFTPWHEATWKWTRGSGRTEGLPQ